MAETVEERVKKVFAEFKKMSPEDIKNEMTFEELGLDSLDGLNLVFELEEEFDLTVPDDKIKDFKSISQVIEGMEMLVEAKAAGIDIEAEAAKDFAAQQAKFRAHKEAQSKATESAATEEASAETAKAEETPAESAEETAEAEEGAAGDAEAEETKSEEKSSGKE